MVGEIIVSVINIVDSNKVFCRQAQDVGKQTREGEGERGRGRRVGTGGLSPINQGMMISASSNGGLRRRRLSIFHVNER